MPFAESRTTGRVRSKAGSVAVLWLGGNGTDPLAVKQSEFNPTVIRILISLYYSDGVHQPGTELCPPQRRPHCIAPTSPG